MASSATNKSKKSKKRPTALKKPTPKTTPNQPTPKTQPLTLGDKSPVLSVTCRFCGAELVLGSPELRLFSRRDGVEGRPCRHAAAVTLRLAVSTSVIGGGEFQNLEEFEWAVAPIGKGDSLGVFGENETPVASTIAKNQEREYEFVRQLQIVSVAHPSRLLTKGDAECWVTIFVTAIFTEDQRRFLDIVEESFPGVFDIWDKK